MERRRRDEEDGVFAGLRRLEVIHVLSIEEENATGYKMVHGVSTRKPLINPLGEVQSASLLLFRV